MLKLRIISLKDETDIYELENVPIDLILNNGILQAVAYNIYDSNNTQLQDFSSKIESLQDNFNVEILFGEKIVKSFIGKFSMYKIHVNDENEVRELLIIDPIV